MAFLGMAPIGSLLTGTLAHRFSIVTACLVNGSACVVAAAFFAMQLPRLREIVRPIYVRLNLLPPLTTGIENASELKLMVK